MVKRLLVGEKVRLTALGEKDLPTVAGWYENSLFLRLIDWRPAYPQTEAQLEEWLRKAEKNDDHFLFGIRPAEGDTLLGLVELDEVVWAQGTCGLGIGIGDEADWDKGYGSEAVRLVLEFAFLELNLHRVQLGVFDYNERAVAVYERLGFQREGVLRESLRRDGVRYDLLVYGILRHEWEAGQEAMGG